MLAEPLTRSVKGIPKKVNITCVSLGKQDNRGDKHRGENQNLPERRTINIGDRGGQRANPLTEKMQRTL
jgi:hypothetical protein